MMIPLNLVCCSAQPEMGTHIWDQVVKLPPGSCLSHFYTDCEKSLPCPKRIALDLD